MGNIVLFPAAEIMRICYGLTELELVTKWGVLCVIHSEGDAVCCSSLDKLSFVNGCFTWLWLVACGDSS